MSDKNFGTTLPNRFDFGVPANTDNGF